MNTTRATAYLYVKIVTAKKEFLSKISTHEIEALLPSSRFKRIHRSFIVSLDKIESYTAEEIEVHGVSIPWAGTTGKCSKVSKLCVVYRLVVG